MLYIISRIFADYIDVEAENTTLNGPRLQRGSSEVCDCVALFYLWSVFSQYYPHIADTCVCRVFIPNNQPVEYWDEGFKEMGSTWKYEKDAQGNISVIDDQAFKRFEFSYPCK